MRAADQSFATTLKAGEEQPPDEKATAVQELPIVTNQKSDLMEAAAEKTVEPTARKAEAAPLTPPAPHSYTDAARDVEKRAEQSQQAQKPTKSAEVVPPASSTPVFEKISSQPAVDITNDPARLADIRSRELINQVARHIDMSISQGRNSLRVQLFPEEMGRISLHLTNNANGLTITLIADQQATNQALAKQFDQLRQTLADAGIQFSELNIGQNGSFQQQADSQQPSHHSIRAPRPERRPYWKKSKAPILKESRGNIDYRI